MGNQAPFQPPLKIQPHLLQPDSKSNMLAPGTFQNPYPRSHLTYTPVDMAPQSSHLGPQTGSYSDRVIAPRTSQIQAVNNQLQGSRITSNLQQSKAVGNHFQGKKSFIGSQNMIQPKPTEGSEVQIIVKPEYGQKGPILQKNNKRNRDKVLKIDSQTEQVDDIRRVLRDCQNSIAKNLSPMFQKDIVEMNAAIETERQLKLKDKNKVLFLLKQRDHYHKLGLKMKSFDDKIKSLLLQLRKKDTLQRFTPQDIALINQSKIQIETFLKSIEADLPKKGWRMIVDKVTNKYYLNVVHSAIQDPGIMKEYALLEQSLTNPHVLQQITNEEMSQSITRRVGTETTQEQAKKLIEGPAKVPRSNDHMK